jgi:cell division protein FtsB
MTDKLFLLTEAAEVTGVTVEALRQRIKRRKLHAVKGNDGLLRVRLTQADIEAIVTGRPTGQPVEDSGVIKALEAHVQTLREQLDRQRTDHAAEVKLLRDDIERARLEADRWRETAERERDNVHALFDRLQEMTERLDWLHQEHRAELKRPWWRRLIK